MANTFVKYLKEICSIPELRSASILKVNKLNNTNDVHVEGYWSLRNLGNNEKSTLRSYYICDKTRNATQSLPSTLQDSRVILSSSSPSASKYAYLSQNEEHCYLNVISEDQKTLTINLKDEDVHSKVYRDPVLSSFCWSQDSKFLAFVAEKKRPKGTSFMNKKPEKADNEGWGEKYKFYDDWGEQMTGQHQSVIVVVDVTTSEIRVLELPEDRCGGEIVWAPDGGLVGVAFVTKPFRMGLFYCKNRAAVLYHMDLDGNFTELLGGDLYVQSPRFSPDGSKLVFLLSGAGGTHVKSSVLSLMDWKERTTTIVVDHVTREGRTKDGKAFFGLCGLTVLPKRCWSSDSSKVVLSTPSRFATATYVIDVESKAVVCPSVTFSMAAHDVVDDLLLVSCSSLAEPSRLALLNLASSYPDDCSDLLAFISPEMKVEGIPSHLRPHMWTFVNPDPHPKAEFSDLPVPALYFGPTELEAGSSKRPLIVWPHGGPHSVLENYFYPLVPFFLRCGYAVLIPNYRGSLGQGKDFIDALPGFCGQVDASDVYQATLQCLSKFSGALDSSRVGLFGGSHGGFLVTHLSAQHPETYKAVITRNPVVDISTMTSTTDITDWNFVESGLDYERGRCYDGDELLKMFNMSPLSLVDRVRAPTLILLGKEDRRVPISQGFFYYRMLMSRQVQTKLQVYDDCHSLDKVDVNADVLIQSALWLQRYL